MEQLAQRGCEAYIAVDTQNQDMVLGNLFKVILLKQGVGLSVEVPSKLNNSTILFWSAWHFNTPGLTQFFRWCISSAFLSGLSPLQITSVNPILLPRFLCEPFR